MLISPDRRLHHRTRLLAPGYLHQDICTNQIQNDFQHQVKPQFWWQLLLNWCVLGFTSIMIRGKGQISFFFATLEMKKCSSSI